MNSYIKHIIEAFDFNSINKHNKSVNSYDILFQIFDLIDHNEKLTDEQYSILTSFTRVYRVQNLDKLKDVITSFIS
jgi:hypothetical protein